jgi:hypothetical protein
MRALVVRKQMLARSRRLRVERERERARKEKEAKLTRRRSVPSGGECETWHSHELFDELLFDAPSARRISNGREKAPEGGAGKDKKALSLRWSHG